MLILLGASVFFQRCFYSVPSCLAIKLYCDGKHTFEQVLNLCYVFETTANLFKVQ